MTVLTAAVIIRTDGATKYYNRGRPNQVLAVNDISLSVGRGEFVVLKGPSGSGKTTLLSLLGCMTRPTSGSITVLGRDVSHLPERFLTEIRRKTYGFIFQQFHLIQGMSVLQNVTVPLLPTDAPASLIAERARRVLDTLGMTKRIDFQVRELSGGEQQRTAIARALINDPEMILADEPTANLDTALSKDFMRIMSEFSDAGKTIVIASHDPLVFEHDRAGLIVEMRDGSVLKTIRKHS